MKAVVCYPPDFSIPTMPFGALALFNACLRQAGHETRVIDLAAVTFNHLSKRSNLDGLLERVDRELATVADLSDPAQAARAKQLNALQAIPRSRMFEAEEAFARLQQPRDYFTPEQLRSDMQAQFSVLQVLAVLRPWLDPRNEGFTDALYERLDAIRSDPWIDCYDLKLGDDLKAFAPDLVAITIPFSTQIFGAMCFSRWVHENLPGTKVVVGGTGVSDAEHVLLADTRFFDYVDYAVMGEGEDALPELVRRLEAGEDVTGVPSLFHLEDGRVVAPVERPYVEMDAAPIPDYTGIDFSLYGSPEKIASLTTSRGCYYGKCTFCPESFRLRFRRRGSGKAWEDVRHIAVEQGINNFMFWDPLTPPAMLEEISRESKREGVEINWMAQVKFDEMYMDEDYVRTLAEGGCRWLQFGFESGVQRVLNDMQKGNDLDRIEHILGHLEQYNIAVGVFWFIGFPTELEEDARETWRYLTRRRHRIHFTGYIGIFGMGHDVPVFKDPEPYGIEVFTTPEGEPRYRRKDGKDWDFYHLHETYYAHNDLPLIESGAALLYAKHERDVVPRLTARNLLSPPRFIRPGSDLSELKVPKTNGFHTWEEGNQSWCWVGHAPRLQELHPGDMEVLDALRGGATFDEIVAATGQGVEEVQSRLTRFVDFCVLETRPLEPDEPVSGDEAERMATAG